MAIETQQFCSGLDRSIVMGDGKNLFVLINQGSGINSVAKLSTCDGLTEECESRLAALAGLLIEASTAIDTTGKTPRELAGEVAILTERVKVLEAEMSRYLPLLEWLEGKPSFWEMAAEGTGVATANGYRHALARVNQPAAADQGASA